jgi:hypothetical protein
MSLHSLGVKLQVVDLTVKFPGVQIILLNSVVFLDSALQVRRVDLHAAQPVLLSCFLHSFDLRKLLKFLISTLTLQLLELTFICL